MRNSGSCISITASLCEELYRIVLKYSLTPVFSSSCLPLVHRVFPAFLLGSLLSNFNGIYFSYDWNPPPTHWMHFLVNMNTIWLNLI